MHDKFMSQECTGRLWVEQASRGTFCVSLERQTREAGDAKSKIPKEIYDYELLACDPHVYVSFLWLSSIFSSTFLSLKA